jgi:hypothetical protein
MAHRDQPPFGPGRQAFGPRGSQDDARGEDWPEVPRRTGGRGPAESALPSNYGRFGPYAWAGAGSDGLVSHRGRGPRGYTRSDDRVHEDVCEQLAEDALVDASEIEVTVASGEVTLDGEVSSRAERRRAEDCAHDVPGVVHVQNNIRVRHHVM